MPTASIESYVNVDQGDLVVPSNEYQDNIWRHLMLLLFQGWPKDNNDDEINNSNHVENE